MVASGASWGPAQGCRVGGVMPNVEGDLEFSLSRFGVEDGSDLGSVDGYLPPAVRSPLLGG